MSLDILLTKNGEEISEMNWLRNPFGLCNWAMDNARPDLLQYPLGLWFVCNHWAYDKSSELNRVLFKGVVDAWWQIVRMLDIGYFKFDLPAYRQFIEDKKYKLHTRDFAFGKIIVGSKYDDDSNLLIPMEHFRDWDLGIKNGGTVLQHYKEWFLELVGFAELLQDEDTVFYCSN